MREAPVGWQCDRCVHQAAKRSPVIRWRPNTAGGVAGRGTLGATRPTPATVALIAINVVVYVIETRNFDNTVDRFGLYPYAVHDQGQWYRLITSAFLHANVEHILFNMVTLLIVGPALEAAIGTVRFSAVYLLAALGGSVASYLLSSPNIIGVGASGAIFGVMGGYYVVARRNHWDLSTVTALIALNLVLGFLDSGIDWRDHLGGIGTGAAVTFGFVVAAQWRGHRSWSGQVGVAATALVVLGLLSRLPPGHVNL
jgi:membrane associated rhomboid family serine protease